MRTRSYIALLSIGLGLSHVAGAQGKEPELKFSLASSGFMCAEPVYPFAALRSGAQGVTRVVYTVGESGEITDPSVQASAGETREHKLLDRSALLSVRSCKYKGNAAPKQGSFSFDYRWSIP